MPPKKQAPPAKTKKVVEDKTFGMKNKKGGAAQKQIKQLQTQAANSKSAEQKRKDAEKAQREKEKLAAEEARREAAALLGSVQVQKIPFGVDPKTVVCQFWKKGNCEKGKKCKFAHDLAVERKSEKKSLYTDTREAEDQTKKEDDMSNWDEEKLRKVVMSKHGNPRTTTDKVCKYFLEAVEDQKYGWFWTCPNGGEKCMYRHNLPPGFVYKTREQRLAEKELNDKLEKNALTLEDWLESERYKIATALGGKLTPVTAETFAKWKKERMDKKAAQEEAKRAKEATGRMLFEKGDWKADELDVDDGSDDEDDDDDDDENAERDRMTWNLAALRKQTELARQKMEEARLAMLNGTSGAPSESNGEQGEYDDDGGDGGDGSGGGQENGEPVNGGADANRTLPSSGSVVGDGESHVGGQLSSAGSKTAAAQVS